MLIYHFIYLNCISCGPCFINNYKLCSDKYHLNALMNLIKALHDTKQGKDYLHNFYLMTYTFENRPTYYF